MAGSVPMRCFSRTSDVTDQGPITSGRRSGSNAERGSRGGYLTTWRLMLRLARREMGAHRVRTALTVLLVALPVLIVSAGATLIVTAQVSPIEALPAQMGHAQALIQPGNSSAVSAGDDSVRAQLSLDPHLQGGDPLRSSPRRLPGYHHGAPTPGQIMSVTGGDVRPLSLDTVRVSQGERRIHATVLGIDGRENVYTGMARLDTGRWPAASGEVAVSAAGASIGIPTNGQFTVTNDAGQARILRVVGTVTTPNRQALVSLPSSANNGFLLDRSTPLTWSQVRDLNAYGLIALSAQVVRHPPAVIAATNGSGGGSGMGPIVVLLLTGIAIMTVLLAGPAFTISGVRHRRALGQLASNGAQRSMLRRYVLAQAVLLGAISAVVGVSAGAALGAGAAKIIVALRPTTTMGPVDLRVGWLIGLAVFTALTCLVAALIPAIQASNTNIVAVLHGQVSPRRVRKGLPVLGLVLAVAGGVGLIRGLLVRSASANLMVVGGGVLLFTGAIMCLPVLLASLGRCASVLPVAGRVGVRDVARQRGRSISSVGATLAVVAISSALAIAGTSDNAQQRKDYQPQAPMGAGVVSGPPAALTQTQTTLRTQVPGVTTYEIGAPTGTSFLSGQPVPGTRTPLIAVLPAGCTLNTVVSLADHCATIGNVGQVAIGIAKTATLTTILSANAAQRAVLQGGGMLFVKTTQPAQPGVSQDLPVAVADGPVRVAVGSATYDSNGILGKATTSKTVTLGLRSVHVTGAVAQQIGGPGQQIQAFITPETAARLGVRTQAVVLVLRSPGGINHATEQSISDRLPNNTSLYVEHGFSSITTRIIQIMLAAMAVLVLVVTVIGGALLQGEAAPDQATLGALGATKGLRRRIAGTQALALGLTGSVVGLVTGLVPGVAVCYPLTDSGHGVTIVLPWVALTAVVLGVPIAAGLLAMLFTRRAPGLTQRTT